MSIKNEFRAGLFLSGLTKKQVCEELGTSATYLNRIIDFMDNNPDQVPSTDLASKVVGKVIKVVNSVSEKVKEVA